MKTDLYTDDPDEIKVYGKGGCSISDYWGELGKLPVCATPSPTPTPAATPVPTNRPAVLENGNADNGTENWRAWSTYGGTVNVVNEDGNNVIEFVPAKQIYSSVSYEVQDYVLNNPSVLSGGYGAGYYKVSFRAKAAEDKSGKFSITFSSQTTTSGQYYSAASVITMIDEWTTYDIIIEVTETVHNVWVTNGCNEIGLRFDASGKDSAYINEDYFTYYVDDVVITRYTPTPKPDEAELKGAQVDVGSTLTLNFAAALGADVKDATMKITRNGKEEIVTGTEDENGLFVFKYAGINAQCMNEEVTAEIIKDGKVLSTKTYSIRQNAENLYNNKPANHNEEQHEALKKFLANMLAYGAACQDYRDYKEDELVTKGLEEWAISDSLEAPEDNREIAKDTNTTKGARITSLNVNISSEYKLVFKFDLDKETYGDRLKVYLGDKDITNEIEDNKYTTAGIKANQNDMLFNVTIKLNGEVVSDVKYSVNSYIANKYGDSKVGNIVKAIHSYGEAAKAYQKIAPKN